MEGLHLCGHGRNDKKRGESKPFVDGVLVTWECMGLGYRGEEELKNMARLRVWVGGRLGPWKSGEACLGGGGGVCVGVLFGCADSEVGRACRWCCPRCCDSWGLQEADMSQTQGCPRFIGISSPMK